MHNERLAWQVWSWLEATNWRWPPDVLLRQPEALMEDIATIAWFNGQVEQMRRRQNS